MFLPFRTHTTSQEKSKRKMSLDTTGLGHRQWWIQVCQSGHSFIHSFIADIYIAPLQVGLLRSAPNPSASE